jgi:hypothetical protein
MTRSQLEGDLLLAGPVIPKVASAFPGCKWLEDNSLKNLTEQY